MTFVTDLVRVQSRRDGLCHATIRGNVTGRATPSRPGRFNSPQMLRVIELCAKTNQPGKILERRTG